MDTIITTLDQHEMDSHVATDNREYYFERKAVRAVLIDHNGRVALLHAKQRDYYKLPGGGIDEGEDSYKALERELIEESGATAKITKELGQVIEWRDYKQMKQISYAFSATVVGEPGATAFTQSELDEGFEVVWTDSLEEAIGLVDANTTSTDMDVLFMSKRDVAILRAASAIIPSA